MKNNINYSILLTISIFFGLLACNSNSNNKKENIQPNNYGNREKLAKNNIIERHISWAGKNLKGKVKVLITKNYKVTGIDDKQNKILNYKNLDSFDIQGNEILSINYNDKESIENKFIMKFDEHGNDTANYFYNAEGKYISRSIYKYDNKGNEIQYNSYLPDGKPEPNASLMVNKYDEKDNLIEMNHTSDDGKLIRKSTFKYDTNGYVIEGKTVDSSGKVLISGTHKNDVNGNKLESIIDFQNGQIDKIICKYDEKGHKIEEIIKKQDSIITSKTVFKYDETGNRTEAIVYYEDGTVNDEKSRYTNYEYDKTGNIIKKTKLGMINGIRTPFEITEMEIVYY